MTASGIPFGRYRLLERLAVGGMAELFRAVLSGPYGFEKAVAIKKILPRVSRDQRFRRMFLHEGRIMAALNHRNLVQVFELGEVEGELFMCLELVDGCDLARVLSHLRSARRQLDPALVAFLVREINRGLAYVHGLRDPQGRRLRVIHRDINPKNILISREGDLKLGDFGIAKSIVQEYQTQQGLVRGKLQYLSPEQARGDAVSHTSDLYSVGLIQYELSTLEHYLEGEGEAELIQSALAPGWRPIRRLRPDFPQDLESVNRRALSPAPELRFAAAEAYAQALSQFLDRAPRSPDGADLARLVIDALGDYQPVDSPGPAPGANTAPPAGRGRPDSPEASGAPVRTRTLAQPAPEAADRRPSRIRRLGWRLLLPLGVALVATAAWFAGRLNPREPASARPIQPRPDRMEQGSSIHEPDPIRRGLDAAPDPSGSRGPAQPLPIPQPDALPPAAPPDLVASDTVPEVRERSGGRPARRKRKRRSRADGPGARRQAEAAAGEPGAAQPADGLQQPLLDALDRQKQRLVRQGVRPQDDPGLDRLLVRCARQLRSGELDGAARALRELESAIDGLRLDERFLDRKLKRLQRALERTGSTARYAGQVREILRLTASNQFDEANARINRVLDALSRP